MIKDGPIERTPCQSRAHLVGAYYDTHADFEESLWEQSGYTLPSAHVAARREVRLACMMGGPL